MEIDIDKLLFFKLVNVQQIFVKRQKKFGIEKKWSKESCPLNQI
jgi:hypothetical protein